MISYEPLWTTLERKGLTTYTLRKGGVSSSTIRRMKAGSSISTNTLDLLCKILSCTIEEIIVYIPDKENEPAH